MVWLLTMNRFKIGLLSFLFFLPVYIASVAAGQIEFVKKDIIVGSKKIVVEVADSNSKRQQGLMNRTHLKPNHGMIFIFDQPQTLVFWMKNTKIPLSIGFFDSNKKLINVEEMHPPKSLLVQDDKLKRYASKKPAKFALEMELGWFKSNKIYPGQKFRWLE